MIFGKLPIISFFIISFYIFFHQFLFIYITISKNLSAKYHQKSKERLQKKAPEEEKRGKK